MYLLKMTLLGRAVCLHVSRHRDGRTNAQFDSKDGVHQFRLAKTVFLNKNKL